MVKYRHVILTWQDSDGSLRLWPAKFRIRAKEFKRVKRAYEACGFRVTPLGRK
jgi:hypothetical protein